MADKDIKTYNVQDIMNETSIEGKIVRRFLRANVPNEMHPGRGAQWAIKMNESEFISLANRIREWDSRTGIRSPINFGDISPE